MNPLSPFTYYIRHKGQALLLLVLIASLTLGAHTLVILTDAMTNMIQHSYHYLTRMSRLLTRETPRMAWQGEVLVGGTLDSGVVAQLRAHPDVAAVLPENGLHVGVPVGGVFPFPMLGVTQSDLPVVMEACDLRLKEGRSIRQRAGEILLSEELARALDLDIGDRVSYETDTAYYQTFATELTLVGILESVHSDVGPEVRAGFVSYEYLEGHELYQPRATNWLILPRPGSRIAANDFAASLIDESAGPTSVILETFESEMEWLKQPQRTFDAMWSFVDGLVGVAAALVTGMVHRIAINRRLSELGLLHAAGHSKRHLLRRLTIEIASIACVGWATGLLCAYAVLILLDNTFFAAQGWNTNLADPTPVLYTLPIPLVVIGWISVSVRRTLSRLDPVSIIERGKMSAERDQPKRKVRRAASSPLSSLTFLARHRRRSGFLVAAISLMVLGVALPGFFMTAWWESVLPVMLGYVSRTAVVSPGYAYRTVPPDIIAQIRAHPAVAHAIPVKGLSMMVNSSLWSTPMSVYAVREQDLPILLEVYDLHLSDGELVQPRSGNIVLTHTLARNRNLGVGDAIGHPVHERDAIPTEMKVVGLLEPSDFVLAEQTGYNIPPMPLWLGFASYEYVDGHERYAGTPEHLLVVPTAGRESEMEMWLEETIASSRVEVATLGTSYRLWRNLLQSVYGLVAISITILTVAAAVGLAILNTISFAQRRGEFGILHAVGHSRKDLTTRVLRESVGLTAAAWLIGAACCLAFLLSAQTIVYVPRGMNLDLTNPTPWLFTLPIPVAVVAASASTIAWALSRLDPVAVIERR